MDAPEPCMCGALDCVQCRGAYLARDEDTECRCTRYRRCFECRMDEDYERGRDGDD